MAQMGIQPDAVLLAVGGGGLLSGVVFQVGRLGLRSG
ncbi:hypothetical protein QWA_17570, partial [Alcaligenes faecalis subsp. faecalis NCIB 8687]